MCPPISSCLLHVLSITHTWQMLYAIREKSFVLPSEGCLDLDYVSVKKTLPGNSVSSSESDEERDDGQHQCEE